VDRLSGRQLTLALATALHAFVSAQQLELTAHALAVRPGQFLTGCAGRVVGHEVFVFDSNPAVASSVAQEIGASHLKQLSDIAVAEIIVKPIGK